VGDVFHMLWSQHVTLDKRINMYTKVVVFRLNKYSFNNFIASNKYGKISKVIMTDVDISLLRKLKKRIFLE